MKNAGRVLALAVLMLAGQASYAQNRAATASPQEAGWYLGVGIGQSRTSFSNADFTFANATISETRDTGKTASKFFAGYDFTRNWGVEGGFTSLGTPEYRYGGTTTGQDRFKASSWNLAAKGTLPLNNRFDLFAKLGATSNRASTSLSTTGGNVLSQSANKTRGDVLAGVGAAYNFDRNISARLEYESYGKFGNQVTPTGTGQTGRASIGMWSIGMTYKF